LLLISYFQNSKIDIKQQNLPKNKIRLIITKTELNNQISKTRFLCSETNISTKFNLFGSKCITFPTSASLPLITSEVLLNCSYKYQTKSAVGEKGQEYKNKSASMALGA
jgi:hypothetical protein